MKNLDNSWLIKTPIAHRGLWNDKIVENSICAYQNAIDNNYPIEIDLFSTTDKVLLSFHDDDLERMTGIKGKIYEKSFNEIKKLRLKNTDETIPTFNEILELVHGKVPLLIEIKNQPSKTIVIDVLNELKNYQGEYAIQSFNPLYIKQVKDYDENIVRGILSAKEVENESFINSFVVKKMPLNFLCKPDFISREFIGLPLKKRKTKNRPVIAWTVTSENDYEKIKPYVNNIIFENFIPKK